MWKKVLLLFVTAITSMTQVHVVDAQTARPLPPRMREEEIFVQPEVIPDLTLRVNIHPRLLLLHGRSHGQVAVVMTAARVGVPANQAAFFNQMANPHMTPIVSWHAFVDNVAPFDTGVLVMVRITAVQSLLHDNAHLMEQYSIVEGQVNYIQAFEPKPYVRSLSSL